MLKKQLEIKNNLISNDIIEEIHWLSAQYPKDEIFFEIENNAIKISLNHLDFSHLKNSILPCIFFSTNENRKKVLQEVLKDRKYQKLWLKRGKKNICSIL